MARVKKTRARKNGYTVCSISRSRIWQMWKYDNKGLKARTTTGLSMDEFTREQAQGFVDKAYNNVKVLNNIRNENNIHNQNNTSNIYSAGNKSPATLTLDKFAHQLELRLTKKGLAPGTIDHYLSAMRHLRNVYGGNCDVRKITRAAIWRMQEYLMEQPGQATGSTMTNQAINMNLRHLRGAFGYLVADEILDRNPFSKFEPLYEEKKDYSLSNEELKLLFDTMRESEHQDHVRIARILLYTGARVSEVLQTRREDIDPENLTWTLINVKTKDKRTRDIAITNQIKQDIQHFLTARPDSERPFEIATVDGISRFVRRWLRKAGIVGKKAHSFRHTFATQAVNNGNYSVRDAQVVLGHSTVTVTEGYVHSRPKPKPIEIDIDV